MKAIVNVDKNWGIGIGNSLLNHLSPDMKFFKEKTTGNVVVMGKSTFLSFPGQKALPNRVNIVLTKDESWSAPDVIVCHSLDELFIQQCGQPMSDRQRELAMRLISSCVYLCMLRPLGMT